MKNDVEKKTDGTEAQDPAGGGLGAPLCSANLAILSKECEHRIEACRVNILEAGFAVRNMSPRRAAALLDQCEHYARLAADDARELTRRLLPNAQGHQSQPGASVAAKEGIELNEN